MQHPPLDGACHINSGDGQISPSFSGSDFLAKLEVLLQNHHDRLTQHFEQKHLAKPGQPNQTQTRRSTVTFQEPERVHRPAVRLAPRPVASTPGSTDKGSASWTTRGSNSGSLGLSSDKAEGKRPRFSNMSSFSQFETVHRAVTLGAGSKLQHQVRRSRMSAMSTSSLARVAFILTWVQGTSRKFLDSPWSEVLVTILILSNVVFAGIEVEYMAQLRQTNPHPTLFTISVAYTVAFTLELLLRMLAEGRKFVLKPNQGWNLFDAFIVIISILEMIIGTIESAEKNNLPSVRVIRMARVVRIFRIARIKHFRSLRVLIYSIINTVRSLLWTMLLLFTILYVFGILFTQAAVQALVLLPAKSDMVNPKLEYRYGSVPTSILTLFLAISGGVSWEEVVKPLGDLHPMWTGFYLAYFAFTYFAVLNVVTGVFCQTAIEGANHDHEMAAQAQILEKEKYASRLMGLFRTIHGSNDGAITLQEFEESLSEEKIRAYFASIDLTVDEAFSLFKLLDNEEKHVLNVNDFVTGCLKLRGHAKSIEIAMMMYETRWCMQQCLKQMKSLENVITPSNTRDSSTPAETDGDSDYAL